MANAFEPMIESSLKYSGVHSNRGISTPRQTMHPRARVTRTQISTVPGAVTVS